MELQVHNVYVWEFFGYSPFLPQLKIINFSLIVKECFFFRKPALSYKFDLLFSCCLVKSIQDPDTIGFKGQLNGLVMDENIHMSCYCSKNFERILKYFENTIKYGSRQQFIIHIVLLLK